MDTEMGEKILLCWSGGKDSALALYELRKSCDFEITALLTTITEDYDRVSMHGIRRALLELQAESLGLPLEKVCISKNASNEEYGAKMERILTRCRQQGVSAVAFGDVALQDVREYREKNLARVEMRAIFPLWKRDTAELARTFIGLGFKAVTTCVDSNVLGKEFVGRVFDEKFLAELPSNVDPCGENGEFHSFVYDGPIFQRRISHELGEVVLRNERFYFCDLLANQEPDCPPEGP